jgi:hypothetical protein
VHRLRPGVEARLTLKHLAPPEPNDRMSLKATLSLADPSMLDPVQHGLRLLIDDAQGLRYTDLTVPPNPPQFGDSGLAGDVQRMEISQTGGQPILHGPA